MADNKSRLVTTTHKFTGIYNSEDRSEVPQNFAWKAKNAALFSGAARVCPRYGDEWTRTSAHASDVGYGYGEGEFDGTTEGIAIVKHNGEANARAYSVNLTTGVFTQITDGDGNDVSALDPSEWHITQYDKFFYISCPSTGDVYIRQVGGKGSNESPQYNWTEFTPEFVRGSGSASDYMNKPGYTVRDWTGDTANDGNDHNNGAYELEIPASGSMWLHEQESSTIWRDKLYLVGTFNAGLDLTGVDFVMLEFDFGRSSTSSDWFDIYEDEFDFFLSTDAATSITTNSSIISFVDGLSDAEKADRDNTQFDPDDGRSDRRYVRVWLDIRTITTKTGLRRWCVRMNQKHRGKWSVKIKTTWGGADMWDYDYVDRTLNAGRYNRNWALPVEYAYVYYDPSATDPKYSTLTKLSLDEGYLQGDKAGSLALPRLGAEVLHTVPYDTTLNTAGYTKIRLLRKEPEEGEFPFGDAESSTGGAVGKDPFRGRWRILETKDNSGTPGNETFYDRNGFMDLLDYDEMDMSLVTFTWPANITAEVLAPWKQHMCIGASRRIFMSWSIRPHKYLPSPDDPNFVLPNVNDTLAGRTDYMSNSLTDEILNFAVQDVLYAAGNKGLYYLVGDTAYTASYWRLLPGTRTALTRRALAPHLGGVMVAAEDGLWWYQVTRSQAFDQETAAEKVEMSKTVRDSWKDLYNGDSGTSAGGSMVVVSHADEVWCFNDKKFMMLTRPQPRTNDRYWLEGEFTKTVRAAVGNYGRGIRVMFTDGTVVRLGRKSDQTFYLNDDTTAVEWEVDSGEVIGGPRRLRNTHIDADGPITMRVSIDGVIQVEDIVFNADGWPMRMPAFDQGRRWSFKLLGSQQSDSSYNTEVRELSIEWEMVGKSLGR